VRFVLINDTIMEHPIHPRGLWSELENGHGAFIIYKHAENRFELPGTDYRIAK
jgi:FtsP/CotA-like multicopper oxidase with cupredoxin domain